MDKEAEAMITEETVNWQEMPSEKRQQIIMVLVEMLLREAAVQQKTEAPDERGE